MSDTNDRNTAQTALALLQGYAPNGKAQQECSDMYNQLLKDGASPKHVARRMVGALYDGLAYGNWPWTEPA
jgi:hypothetical protein